MRASVRGGNADVDSSYEVGGVGHVGVQGHDVEVVGVTSEDVLDQVCGSGRRQLWVDRRLAVEDGIAGRQHMRPPRPVDPNRREGAVIAHPDTPRVEQHAGEITCVVSVEVGEQHGLHM